MKLLIAQNIENRVMFVQGVQIFLAFANFYSSELQPPWGRRGFKPRIRPPYPQRVVKGD